MKYRFIATVALLLASCDAPVADAEDTEAALPEPAELIDDVPAIVGMTKDEIDAEWGEPNCPPKNACEYGDRLTVYYVNGRAANITLPPVDEVTRYGFEVGSPSFANTGVTRWNVQIGGQTAELSSFANNFVYVETVDAAEIPTSLELDSSQ